MYHVHARTLDHPYLDLARKPLSSPPSICAARVAASTTSANDIAEATMSTSASLVEVLASCGLENRIKLFEDEG